MFIFNNECFEIYSWDFFQDKESFILLNHRLDNRRDSYAWLWDEVREDDFHNKFFLVCPD